jgi:hypothetical protein
MASKLAKTLIGVPCSPSLSGDVIWRNLDLGQVESAAIVPSKELLAELLMFNAGGGAAGKLGRIVPGMDNATLLANSTDREVRLGVIDNPFLSESDLTKLTTDVDPQVAEQASVRLRDRYKVIADVHSGDVKTAAELLSDFVLDDIQAVIRSSVSTIAKATPYVNCSTLLVLLGVHAPQIAAEIAVAVLDDESVQIGAALASWLCGDSAVAANALEQALSRKNTFRRRLTPQALKIMSAAGHIVVEQPPIRGPRVAPLEDMALMLEIDQVAALYFSSDEKVSEELLDQILSEAPETMVVNHLIGQTPRRPRKGEVKSMLVNSTVERRQAMSAALESVVQQSRASGSESSLTGLPWIGELLLGLRRAEVSDLDVEQASELLRSIQEVLGDNREAWEFLMALSEEWEETIYDLVVAAANFENIVLPTSV